MLNILSSEFVKSVVGTNYPDSNLPEFAFLGRSNSGKSSLINMILNRKNLVKTGQTPGMTKMLNYFLINKNFHIVDMPGYGYAKVPVKVKKEFHKLITNYIKTRKEHVRALFLLMDIRRNVSEDELFFLNILADAGIPTALTLTKTDKLNRKETQQRISAILKQSELERHQIFLTSSLKKKGKEEILGVIEDFLR